MKSVKPDRRPSLAPFARSEPPYPSAAHRTMHAWLLRVARADLPALIEGESGSGKEGVSRAVHRASARRQGPFVAVNCTALTESLLEAELFGAVRGAYTGAERDRTGLLKVAHGGTLLLDEVGDMPAAMQAKLLRALEQGRIRPVGGTAEIEVDVRVLAATHRNLEQEIAAGRFRADLYYRLAVLKLRVPPLRERLADLPRLVEELIPRLARQTGHRRIELLPAAWCRLRAHPWPGNVRELHAVLARALLRSDGAAIDERHLELPADPEVDAPRSMERGMIERALRIAGGSVALAATRIGWSRQKLYRRMEILSIPRQGWGTTSSDSSTFQ